MANLHRQLRPHRMVGIVVRFFLIADPNLHLSHHERSLSELNPLYTQTHKLQSVKGFGFVFDLFLFFFICAECHQVSFID